MPDPPRELTITRVLSAPRALVWRAWTEPEQLARWWGPKGVRTPLESIHIQARPGGAFRLTLVAEADGSTYRADGTLREVTAPEVLVLVEPPGASDDDAIQVARVRFTEAGEGRTQVALHTRLRLPEHLLPGARAGWGTALDKLEALLAGTAGQ